MMSEVVCIFVSGHLDLWKDVGWVFPDYIRVFSNTLIANQLSKQQWVIEQSLMLGPLCVACGNDGIKNEYLSKNNSLEVHAQCQNLFDLASLKRK